ncbi:MAG TPA: nitroreductase family protein, partial [bacterium]|nr:nitroreductase family protein [bacterium]
RYLRKEIPRQILERILEAARQAPSGNNRQPWHFIVVQEAALKEKIAAACYEQSFVRDAAAVIVACGQKYPNPYQPLGDNCYLIDVTIAVDHLILAARNEGLGSCWVGAFHPEPIKKLLGIPAGLTVVMVVPLGYPESETCFHSGSSRKPLSEIVSREQYGRKT